MQKPVKRKFYDYKFKYLRELSDKKFAFRFFGKEAILP